MKKIKWLTTVLVVANLLLGVIGCKDPEIHIHTYSEAWTSDASGHWHAATCGHTTEVSDKAEHTLGIWEITNEPTETEVGQMQSVCEVCGTVTKELQPAPKGFRFVKGVTITGTESWTPESEVFVSGRKLTIPDLIVSDHEVTRGEYKAVMKSLPEDMAKMETN